MEIFSSMDKQKQRVVLVHHHIFKNAGTSFNHAMKNAFGDGFCEYDLPNSQVVTHKHLEQYIEDNPRLNAISGHHICLPTLQRENYKTVSSVILRHPLSRIRSIYEFERKQKADTDGAIMAKKMSFKEFVSWRLEDSPHVFCNYQTLYCSRKDNVASIRSLNSNDLDIAIQNIENCFAVGTVQKYREFLMMAQYEASNFFNDIFFRNSHLNITSSARRPKSAQDVRSSLVEQIGETLVQELEFRNSLDMSLYEFGEQRLQNWLECNSDQKSVFFSLSASSKLKKRDWQNAKAEFQNCLFLKPDSFKDLYSLAEAFERLGDIESAISCYRQVVEMKPGFAWAHFRLGKVFLEQGALDDSIAYFEKAIEVHDFEKSYWFYLGLGDALTKSKQIDDAIDTYLIAEKIKQEPLESKGRLCWIYEYNNDSKNLAAVTEQLFELGVSKCRCYMSLGDAYVLNGDYEKAVYYFELGLKEESDNTECRDRLQRTHTQVKMR